MADRARTHLTAHALTALLQTATWVEGVVAVLNEQMRTETRLMQPEPWAELQIEKYQVEKLIAGLTTVAANVRGRMPSFWRRRGTRRGRAMSAAPSLPL